MSNQDTEPEESPRSKNKRMSYKHSSFFPEVESMSDLPNLNEREILSFLSRRYEKDIIYTYFGPILIAMNPYKELPNLYEERRMGSYSSSIANLVAAAALESQPHIWDVSRITYNHMKKSIVTQSTEGSDAVLKYSILVSGVAGSGKSESHKLLLKHLINESNVTGTKLSSADADAPSPTARTVSMRALTRAVSKSFSFLSDAQNKIVDKVLLSGLVLEAFGNAKTLQNDNSSRVGLYTEMSFNSAGVLMGGELHPFMLDTNRLHTQHLGERNFHIFYQLVNGLSADEKTRLSIGNVRDYTALNLGRSAHVSQIDDSGDFATLRQLLDDLDFDEPVVDQLLEAVAATLHSTQLQFKSSFDNNGEGCRVTDMALLPTMARQLGVSAEELEQLFTVRNSMMIRGESIERKMTAAHAVNARNAVTMAMYKRLFEWLVFELNKRIGAPAPPATGVTNGSEYNLTGGVDANRIRATVGVLDIFGFEHLDSNSISQLCVNYANETFQQHMNVAVFEQERKFMVSEGVELKATAKQFNAPNAICLDFLSNELFSLLDEVCTLPEATDSKFASKIYARFGDSSKVASASVFSSSILNQTDKSFCITHYAGVVTYSTRGFVESNTEELPRNAASVFDKSTNVVFGTNLAEQLRSQSVASQSSDSPFKNGGKSQKGAPKASANTRRASLLNIHSAVTTFKNQLSSLMERLEETVPQYVRCIKPTNTVYHRVAGGGAKKRPSMAVSSLSNVVSAEEEGLQRLFQPTVVADQLRFSGIVEAARVSRFEYPVRFGHKDFYARYRFMLSSSNSTAQLPLVLPRSEPHESLANYATLLVAALKVDDRVKGVKLSLPVGATKVFLTPQDQKCIDTLYDQLTFHAKQTVGNFCACVLLRTWFKKTKPAVDLLQRNARVMIARHRYLRYRKTVVSLQRTLRNRVFLQMVFNAYDQFKHSMLRVQAMYRRHRCQQKLKMDAFLRAKIESNLALLQKAKSERVRRRSTIYTELSTPVQEVVKTFDAKTSEFRALDDALRAKLDLMVKALKPPVSTVANKVLFDVSSSKKLLYRWAGSMDECQFKYLIYKVAAEIDFGFRLLKPAKFQPQTFIKKIFHTASSGNSDPNTAVLDEHHGVFKAINALVADILELLTMAENERVAGVRQIAHRKAELKKFGPTYSHRVQCEQVILKMQQSILYAGNVTKFCTILKTYFTDYVAYVVRNYGSASPYRAKFADNKAYIEAVSNLLSQQKPLHEASELYLTTLRQVSPATQNHQNIVVTGDFPLKVHADDFSRILQFEGLYFKYMPYCPGIEYTVNCMTSLFSADTLCPTRILRVKGAVNKTSKVAYYQAAERYSIHNFNDILSTPVGLELLESEGLSSAMVSSLVLGVSFLSPENVMLELVRSETGELSAAKVVGITNNFAFTEGLFDYKTLSNATVTQNMRRFGYNKSNCLGGNYNLLYFLPQMDEPVDKVVGHIFGRHEGVAEELVSEWLKQLYLRNKGYEALQRIGFTEEDYSILKVPIYLPKRTGVSVYRRLKLLATLLESSRDAEKPLTHHDVLAAFCPLVSKYYKTQRSAFTVPEYSDLVPYNLLYGESVGHSVGKRRASVQRSASTSSPAHILNVATVPVREEDKGLTMAQRLIKQRASERLEEQQDKLAGEAHTPLKRPKSIKFDQIYGTPHTKARATTRNQLGAGRHEESYICLDFGGIYGNADEDIRYMYDGEDGEQSETRPFNGSAADQDESNLDSGNEAPGFDYDNIYGELGFAEAAPGAEEVMEFQSPPRRKMPEPGSAVSFNMTDVYGGGGDEISFDRDNLGDHEASDRASEAEEEYPSFDRDASFSHEMEYDDLGVSGDEEDAADQGPRPPVLPHDPEEIDPQFNTSVVEVATEFLKSIDFSSLATEHCRRLVDNLYFVQKLWMFNVSEEQLREMFSKYIRQGAPGSLRRTPSKDSHSASAPTPEPLLIKEIVLTGKDEDSLLSVSNSEVMSEIKRVLQISVSVNVVVL